MDTATALEILKLSGAARPIMDLLNRVTGAPAEEIGQLLADKVRAIRWENALTVWKKRKRLLQDAGLPEREIPTRLLLPMIEASSVEDDDDLQEKWAGLLASASQDAGSVKTAYIETLKQLSPDEAKRLDQIFDALLARSHDDKLPPTSFSIPSYDLMFDHKSTGESFERLGLISRTYAVELNPKSRGRFFQATAQEEPVTTDDIEDAISEAKAEIQMEFYLSDYGMKFLQACRGPQVVEPTDEKIG